ncbi:FAD-dependent monooxygenase [Amycolatopsis benzoatilytica]|uniref:FAD-dependent monooxygenase n=1 Tax=Amycolatopsis benzoatilytica TaxID=346045 RepID=UPI00036AD69D|nr:FAD-dependent monooxygenase [Amycolatopsis benzoatilytica]
MPEIAIAGGGIGGLAAAVALRKLGFSPAVYEQAAGFGRVGADINLTPNAVRALDGLGIGDELRATAARPKYRISRTWDTGEETSRLPMGDEAERRYGSPQLTMHRADLLGALAGALPDGVVHLGHKLAGISAEGLSFESGTVAADVLVGADGIHSAVRTSLFGAEHPEFTGVVAYRAVLPAGAVDVPNLDCFTKWWGPDPDTQLVTFPLNRGNDVFVFATTRQSQWRHESWTTPGDVAELREAYRGFHPEARALLAACDSVLQSALYVRDPLPAWSSGTTTLLGDACHPMMPFMAQGAGMAIEDAVVLARALAAYPEPEVALKAYQAARLDRTREVQLGSRGNSWLKQSGTSSAAADALYGYDAWHAAV